MMSTPAEVSDLRPGVRFDVVTEAPLEAVIELYKAGGWWKESAAARAIIPAMIRGSFCFMVASEGERLVGMGRAISDGASDAYIQDVVVLTSHRGRGIGRELIARLTAHCRTAGIGWIGLVAEPGTERFYQQLGYRALAGYLPMLFGQAP
jgi:aralkylamine N-acetyltransferase